MDKKIEESNIMVLRFSQDDTILISNSMSQLRILEEAKFIKIFHIILISRHNKEKETIKLGENVFVYPVSNNIFYFIFDIFKIIKKQIIWRTNLNAHFVVSDSVGLVGGVAIFFAKFYHRRLLIILDKNPFNFKGFKYFLKRKLALYVLNKSYHIEVPAKSFLNILSSNKIDLKKTTVLPLFFGSYISYQEITRNIRDIYPNSFIILIKHDANDCKATYKALTVFKYLRMSYPNMRLGVISSSVDGQISSRISKLGITESVFWETDSRYRIDLLKSSHVYLETHFDPINLQAVEALLCSLPVITVNSGLVPEILRETQYSQFIISGDSLDLFIKTLRYLVEHPSVRDDFRMNIKDIALEWTSSSYEEYALALRQDWEKIALDAK